MTEQEIKVYLDKVYATGFKNGQIEMKSKVLKTINRDWKIMGMKDPVDVAMHFMKKINRLRLSKEITKDWYK